MAVFQHDDLGGKTPDLGEVVRDIDDAKVEREEPGQDVLSGAVVEGGERLIEQKQFGIWGERTSERNAPAFSAGKPRGSAVGEVFCTEEPQHFGDTLGARRPVEVADAECDVVANAQVGKESGLLGDESNRPAAR